jgi:hypothetical protein
MARGYDADTKLGTLLDEPEAKEVLVKFLPEIETAGAMLKLARGMSLRKVSGFPLAKISEEKLQAISTDLAKL